MPDSAGRMLGKACAQAIAIYAAADPVCGGCALLLSNFLETEPAKKLGEKLSEKLAEAFAEKLLGEATEIRPGSLHEAVPLALRKALAAIRKAESTEIARNGWDEWFANWESACKKLRRHRWKDLSGIAREVGHLNANPQQWEFLRETLELLDWSARLAGRADANRGTMEPGLAQLLEGRLATGFVGELKTLLTEDKYKQALVEFTVEIASLASGAQPRRASHRLSGADDPRLRPMRGFFTGREAQKAAALEFLRGDERLAVVTGKLYSVRGAPGVGKSELCKAALHAFLTERPSCRAFFVDVTGARNLDGLRVALADALGDQKLAEEPARLLAAIHAEADLLYLDNLEDALPRQDEIDHSVYGWIDELAHRVRVLASSRQKLGQVAREFPLGRLEESEAMALFEHFWREAEGGPIEGREGLARFLDHDLDRHALTIRLVAAQTEEAPTWQRLRELWLERRTALAEDEGRRDRLSNLDVSISLSFERAQKLPAAAELWIAMACFPEGMGEAARTAVFPDEAVRREAVKLLVRLGVADRSDGTLEMLAPLR